MESAETYTRLTRLLSRLVQLPTVNDPQRGTRPGLKEASLIAEMLRDETGSRYEILEGPSPVLLLTRGNGRPVTLFLAHYDVVPPGPGWSVDPFGGMIREGSLYGRGSADDKSNVAAISHALAEISHNRGTLVAAFTGDEETGGESAAWLARWLQREDLWPDYLVNGDGSLSRIITRRRNAFTARIEVPSKPSKARGTVVERVFESRILLRRTMHSAYFIPGVDTHPLVAAGLWLHDNDSLLASALLGDWVKTNVIPRSVLVRAVRPGEGSMHGVDEGLTLLLRSIVPLVRAPVVTELYSDYGVTVNPNVYKQAAGEHVLYLDVRAMTASRGRVEEALRRVLDATIGSGAYRLRVSGGGGYLYTRPESSLLQLARQVAEGLGLDPRPVEAGGASDSRHFSPHGVDAIDYGPLGYNIHGPDEHVVLHHLCLAREFYTQLARGVGEVR